jgi:hypothetical protein
LDDADLGEDLFGGGGGGPGEGLGVGVPVGDVVADLSDEDFDRGEGAAADGLAGDDAESDLDLVDPGGTARGEVEVHVRGWRPARLGCPGGVGGEVVQHHVNVIAGVRRDGFFKECQEVRAVAGGLVLAQDLPGADVSASDVDAMPVG